MCSATGPYILASHKQVCNQGVLGAVSGILGGDNEGFRNSAWGQLRLTAFESYLFELKVHLPKHPLKNTGPVGCDWMVLKDLIEHLKRTP